MMWLKENYNKKLRIRLITKSLFLKISLVATLIIGGVTSCSTIKNQSVNNDKSSILGEWELSKISGMKSSYLSEAYPEGLPAINFISNKMISAVDGCNILNATITTTKDKITFGFPLSTMKACENVEANNFSSKLNGTLNYKLTKDKLEFLQGKETILTFVRPGKIEGSWILEDLIGRERNSKSLNERFPNGKPALTFADNTISGNDGCNIINGTYTLNGNFLQLNSTAATAVACEGVESDMFMKRLDNINKFEIKGGKLTLFASGIKTMVFSKK